MSLSSELLDQARHLITKEPRRPRQASLRRGVSSAYYALFHKLTDASANFLVGGSGSGRQALRHALRRRYIHGEMKSVSNSFAAGAPPQLWQQAAGAISTELRKVAETFVELQEARHEADYDHARAWTRQEAIELVQRAEQAFDAWER
jgi:uncharacterized protein (UPF0332 family)